MLAPFAYSEFHALLIYKVSFVNESKYAIRHFQKNMYLIVVPTFVFCSDRFYLGLALVQQKNGPGPRAKEATVYLNDGVQYLLELALKQAESTEERLAQLSTFLWRQSTLTIRG